LGGKRSSKCLHCGCSLASNSIAVGCFVVRDVSKRIGLLVPGFEG
jgi:hypothetical protein